MAASPEHCGRCAAAVTRRCKRPIARPATYQGPRLGGHPTRGRFEPDARMLRAAHAPPPLALRTPPALIHRHNPPAPRRGSTCGSLRGLAAPRPQLAIAHRAEEPQQEAQAALTRVAHLASAWGKVSRRLPLLAEGNLAQHQVITALRLAISLLDGAPLREDGRDPITRAVRLCVLLAELSAVGVPLDTDALAACVVAECATHTTSQPTYVPPLGMPALDHSLIVAKLGDRVAALVHDILKVRTAPARTEVLDDQSASALREWCIAFNDIVANVVEVVARWDALQHMEALPLWERQQLAVESLQVWAPLGHALGLGAISSNMEDICFQVLFPESYLHTREWLRTVAEPAEDALLTAQEQLLAALEEDPRFGQLAAGCQMRTRTKSLFSIMKKLLRLGDMAKGGRRHDEVFDLLGMRAVVQPRQDLPPAEAERLATQACYLVQEVAERLWHVVPGRTKDYITRPKASGYASLHLTVCMHSVVQRAAMATSPAAPGSSNQGAGMNNASEQQRQPQRPPFGGECSDAWLSEARGGSTLASSNTSSTSGDEEGGGGGLEGGGVAAPRAAAYLELQVRTQAMDDRAEMGDASHAHYKGGLDARQARLLKDWSRELHARLRLARSSTGGGGDGGGRGGAAGAYKLLLPPSVVAKQVGAFSLLDSVDFDGELVPFPTAASILEAKVEPSGGGGGAGAAAGGAPQARFGGSWYGDSSGSGTVEQQEGQQGEGEERGGQQAWRRAPTSPYEALFRYYDKDGNGSISMEEWREQMRELGITSWSTPPPPPVARASPDSASPTAGSSSSSSAARPMLQRERTPGIITFDASADGEALDAWMRQEQQQQQQERSGGAQGEGWGGREQPDDSSALAQAPGSSSQELSFQEFAALLKQASAVRDQQLLQAQQRQQADQQ